MRRRAALLALGSLLSTRLLAASGVRVEHWLSLGEVVTLSRQILVVQIVRIDSVYNAPPCDPSGKPFVRTFRAEVEVREVLKGARALQGRRVWVLRTFSFVPCRWSIVKQDYHDSVRWDRVKPGSRLLAYASTEGLSPAADGELYLELLGLDELTQRPKVLEAMRQPASPPHRAPNGPPSAPASGEAPAPSATAKDAAPRARSPARSPSSRASAGFATTPAPSTAAEHPAGPLGCGLGARRGAPHAALWLLLGAAVLGYRRAIEPVSPGRRRAGRGTAPTKAPRETTPLSATDRDPALDSERRPTDARVRSQRRR